MKFDGMETYNNGMETYIDRIPDTILKQRILSRLSLANRLNAQKVCQKWKKLMPFDDKILSPISFAKEILQLWRREKSQNLKIAGSRVPCKKLRRNSTETLEKNEEFENLRRNSTDFLKNGASLTNSTDTLMKNEEFEKNFPQFCDKFLAKCLEILFERKKMGNRIKILRFFDSTGKWSIGQSTVEKIFVNCEKLEKLQIFQIFFSGEKFENFIKNLAALFDFFCTENLKEFEFDFRFAKFSINFETFQSSEKVFDLFLAKFLSKFLARCSSLEKLRIFFPFPNNFSLLRIPESLKEISGGFPGPIPESIKEISLRIPGEIFCISSIQNCFELQKLEIFSRRFAETPEFAFGILRQFDHVTVFHAKNMPLSGGDLALLCASMPNLRSLWILVGNNPDPFGSELRSFRGWNQSPDILGSESGSFRILNQSPYPLDFDSKNAENNLDVDLSPISRLENLEELQISSLLFIRFTAESAESIFNRQFCKIRRLHLNFDFYDENFLLSISEICGKTLENFTLNSSSDLEFSGLNWGEFCSQCPALRQLKIFQSKFADLKKFAKAKNLQKFKFYQNLQKFPADGNRNFVEFCQERIRLGSAETRLRFVFSFHPRFSPITLFDFCGMEILKTESVMELANVQLQLMKWDPLSDSV